MAKLNPLFMSKIQKNGFWPYKGGSNSFFEPENCIHYRSIKILFIDFSTSNILCTVKIIKFKMK